MIAEVVGEIVGFVLEHSTWFLGGGAGLAAFLIPGAGPALAFLRANWKWAVPTVIAIVAVIMALWYRGEWKDCQSSVAVDANKAEERLRLQQAADAELRRQLSESLAPIVTDLRKQAQDVQVALGKVQSNPACRDTPAARAFDSIVRPGGQQANPRSSGSARP